MKYFLRRSWFGSGIGVRSNGEQAFYCGTETIQPMPKRSATMPKHGDQKVFPSGIRTCPHSAQAAKSRLASASLGSVSDKENPTNSALSPLQPSESISRVARL